MSNAHSAPTYKQYAPLLPAWVMEIKEKQHLRDIAFAVKESKIIRERNLRAMAQAH